MLSISFPGCLLDLGWPLTAPHLRWVLSQQTLISQHFFPASHQIASHKVSKREIVTFTFMAKG